MGETDKKVGEEALLEDILMSGNVQLIYEILGEKGLKVSIAMGV